MINVRAYEPGDIRKIKPKQFVYDNDPELFNRVEELSQIEDSYCNTFIRGGVPIAVIGLTLLWPKVADVWAVTSDEVKTEPILFHKLVKHSLDFYQQELGIKRYQVFVKAKFSEGKRWMEALGFKEEAKLAYFGPEGDDYYIMGRIN